MRLRFYPSFNRSKNFVRLNQNVLDTGQNTKISSKKVFLVLIYFGAVEGQVSISLWQLWAAQKLEHDKVQHSEKAVKIWKNIIPNFVLNLNQCRIKWRELIEKNAAFSESTKIWKFIQTFYNPLYWVTWAMCNICQREKLIVPLA